MHTCVASADLPNELTEISSAQEYRDETPDACNQIAADGGPPSTEDDSCGPERTAADRGALLYFMHAVAPAIVAEPVL